QDEVEELRCEMLEMRDMFQEEEVYQLQELRLQLEQAKKTCRILQYRLRKAERRSIRVAQTGQVDGELVRSLEHDIKSTLKRRSIRSTVSKAEKRLSQQMEEDSTDLKCQLHFAKEELALMCKKLTKLVSDSEAMREELARYQSTYGDVDILPLPEGKQSSAHAREAEVLSVPPRNGHSSPSSFPLTSPMDVTSTVQAQRPLTEALELLQAMLLAFIEKMDALLRGDDKGPQKEGFAWDFSSFLSANYERLKELHVEEVCSMQAKQKAKQGEVVDSRRDPKLQLSLQILWILHQWCNVRGTNLEGKECRDKTLSALLGLLQDLSAELRDDSKAKSAVCEEAAEDGQYVEDHSNLNSNSVTYHQLFSPRGPQRKNWCYLSQEAAQLDREDPFKTWDHLIMPLSFPGLDFEQMSTERSHTAPEKTTFRIYYSPPSARRVQLAQLKQSPAADRASVETSSPWCTPPTSFSQLCLGSSANLSDDMKEMTASWRQMVHAGSPEKKGRLAGRWVDVACSGTQTHTKPQMVSVGQQTDETQGLRSGSSLVSARSQHISTSLDGLAGRRSSTSSPKPFRRHSSSPSSPPSLSSSSSSSGSRDRGLWHPSQQNSNSLTWTRQTGTRSNPAQNLSPSKLPTRSASANRCGLVTEFLRRVSGRADRATAGSGQKTKSGLKNLERAPTRPLQRNDSVTRIVNQRFIKQREREEKGGGVNQRARNSQSTAATEDGNYDCSSSSTLTFCFARPSRQNQRPTSIPPKLQRHRYSAPAGAAA
uniref:SOGA coiled-coil domain-containing protein n=1 Tax=Poecilia formosa TaxID=48698 RepID=A0A096MH59_POEFO